MTDGPEFELVDIDRLKIHEEIRPELLERLENALRRDGYVAEPILVARDSYVVLNGHHRLAALRALGARRVPAWVVDYDSAGIVLERWEPGPPLTKADVVARARSGIPYRPKTTKHTVRLVLPERRTPLVELGVTVQGPSVRRARRPARVGSSDGP